MDWFYFSVSYFYTDSSYDESEKKIQKNHEKHPVGYRKKEHIAQEAHEKRGEKEKKGKKWA